MMSEKEWMEQHLTSVTPLPFGERTAPRRRWAWARRRFRGHATAIRCGVVVAGVIAGMCGAALAAWPADVGVSMDAASYRLGGGLLMETAPGVFQGDGVLVIAKRSDGSVIATASFATDGRRGTGTCRMYAGKAVERCTFNVEKRSVLDALDVYVTGEGWSRRYLGGAQVIIAARQPVPVPFPVGAG